MELVDSDAGRRARSVRRRPGQVNVAPGGRRARRGRRPIPTSTMTAGAAVASPPPAPWRSPSPRRNQPCGVSRDRVANSSGAWALGAKVPPMIARVMPTAAVADPAASCDDANEITSAETPSAATIAATIRATTPSGGPQSAPMNSFCDDQRQHRDDTRQRTRRSACRRGSCPGRRARRGSAQRPRRRSSNRLTSRLRREEQEQDRHRGAKYVARSSWRIAAVTSTTATGGGAVARRLGDPLLIGGRQRRADERRTVATDSWMPRRPRRTAPRPPRDLGRQPARPRPDDASVAGPGADRRVNPCGMMNAVSRRRPPPPPAPPPRSGRRGRRRRPTSRSPR